MVDILSIILHTRQTMKSQVWTACGTDIRTIMNPRHFDAKEAKQERCVSLTLVLFFFRYKTSFFGGKPGERGASSPVTSLRR